jgi:hypothetical protein
VDGLEPLGRAGDARLVANDLVDLDPSCRAEAFGVGQLPVADQSGQRP